jgi:sigma-B regulation protein RsbU (phosphoserine phosphatase)
MFVTVFCAILNTRTGEVVYANGGHNPPYVIAPGGIVAALSTEPDPIVGALGGITYRREELQLRPGDGIFLYTDGVSEAMDKSTGFFSTSRLEEGLSALYREPVKEAISGMMARVSAFCDGAEQSDDITMMMIRYIGGVGSA